MSEEMTMNEKTRMYLNQLKTIDGRIKNKLEEAERWKSIAENHSSHISEVKVQTSPKLDKMAEAIANAIQYEEESYALANELVIAKHELLTKIDSMEEKYYQVLNLFFVQNKKYKDISITLDCSYNCVKENMRDAVKAFGMKYEDEINEYSCQEKPKTP